MEISITILTFLIVGVFVVGGLWLSDIIMNKLDKRDLEKDYIFTYDDLKYCVKDIEKLTESEIKEYIMEALKRNNIKIEVTFKFDEIKEYVDIKKGCSRYSIESQIESKCSTYKNYLEK